jgi:hypothetical protein
VVSEVYYNKIIKYSYTSKWINNDFTFNKLKPTYGYLLFFDKDEQLSILTFFFQWD